MDEFELARRVYGDLGEDPGARRRLRERLQEAIETEPIRLAARKRRRRASAAGALAAALSVGLIVSLVLPSANAAAAAELRRLGQVAASGQGPRIGPGQFVMTRLEELVPENNVFVGSDMAFTVISHLQVTTWIAADSSGFRRTEVISSGFASPEDRSAWAAAGRPDILPTAGDVRDERFPPDEGPWLDASDLPTDPERLLQALRGGAVAERPPGNEEIFVLIGDVLTQGDASPPLRSALFEVAATLDGVRLGGEVDDPLGRHGVAIFVDGEASRTQLIFDRETARLLAIEDYPLDADGSRGPLRSWIAPLVTTVVDTPPPF
jgi:hypothetical protein